MVRVSTLSRGHDLCNDIDKRVVSLFDGATAAAICGIAK